VKVDGSLQSLLQGVSQQPIRDRLGGQCTEQLNLSSDPVLGLSRRAPSDLIGGLVSTANLRGWHNFETRTADRFILAVHDNTVTVRDLDGNNKTVNVLDASVATYLGGTGKLTFGTVENQVIIANNSIIAEMLTATKPFANKGPGAYPMGIVQVLGGQYGREYSINFNGTRIAMYRPPDGSVASHVNSIRTTWIAQRLFEAMTVNSGTTTPDGAGSSMYGSGALAGAGYAVTRFEDVIWIQKNSAGDFSLTSSDDSGNINMKTMTDQVSDTADLPRIAPIGYLSRVATETDPDDDLFLEFKLEKPYDTAPLGTGFGQKGYWQESTSSDVPYLLNNATMPHVLEYDPDTDTFDIRQGAWKERRVGTEGSNPLPSFIGNTIRDVSTFQSRLVILSGSFVCMSRTNRFEDFWMGSASTLVDSDPIDISSTAVEASAMLAAVPHNRDLVIFSPKGQFVTFGRSAITPANATLVLTTAFEAELNARPQPAGRNIFFATNYGRFTGVREFFTEGNADINDTRPVTQHIKKYMPGRVVKMSSSSNYDTLLVHTDENRDIVYCYQYLWQDEKKLQSAWSKWQYDYEVVFSFFDEEVIYLVLKDGNDYFMLRQSLDAVDVDDVGYVIHTDQRYDVTDCHTAFVLPYDRYAVNWQDRLVVIQGSGCPNPGMNNPVTNVTYDAVNDWYIAHLKYDMEGGTVIAGTRFMSMYRPTMPQIKDQDGVVMATGKLRIKHLIVSLDKSGDINGQLKSKYGDSEVVSYQARIVGDIGNVIGETALSDDKFIMPFRDQTDRADVILFTDKHLPMTMLDIEWVGQFTKRGKRISNGQGSKT